VRAPISGGALPAPAYAAAGSCRDRRAHRYSRRRPDRTELSNRAALAPRDGTDITALMQTADAALYAAKRAGRRQAHLEPVGSADLAAVSDAAHQPASRAAT
jgi:GGDEF domain-containing protein